MSSNLAIGCPQDGGWLPGEGLAIAGRTGNDLPVGSPTLSESIDARLRLLSARVMDDINRATEAAWDRLNRRRLKLIDKDMEQGLSAAEKAELDELENKARDYVNRLFPLPFGMLEKLRECAAKDGFTVNLD